MAMVQRSPAFARDVATALAYLNARSPAATNKLARQVDRTCDLLAAQPLLGRERPDIAPGVRSVTVGGYLLLFNRTADGIIALRLVHGSRNLQDALDDPDAD